MAAVIPRPAASQDILEPYSDSNIRIHWKGRKANAAVVDCVVRRTYLLVFPAPEGGTVTVVYPMMFSPG